MAVLYAARMVAQIDHKAIQVAKLIDINEERVLECVLAIFKQLKNERERVLDEMGTSVASLERMIGELDMRLTGN